MKLKLIVVGLVACGAMSLPVTAVLANEREGASEGRPVLEEIVVTSRKREELLSDVPLYIQAITALQLEHAGITNANDFIGKMPSISKSGDFLSPGKEFSMMVIRGVGANGGMEPAAPVFIDGVYIPRLGFDANFLDVERVELLYGPQSTLFGRNAEAGAINIVTKKPSEEFRAKVAFEWDEFDTYKSQAAVSGQISETLYAGVSIDGMSTRGYLSNIGADNVNSFGGASQDPGAFFTGDLSKATNPDAAQSINARVSLRWIPTDTLEANLTVDTSRFEGGVGLPGVPKDCNCYTTDLDVVLDSEHTSDGVSLRLDYSTDMGFDITSISAYRDMTSSSPFDFDGGSTFGLPDGVTPAVLATNIPGVTNTHQGNIQDYGLEQDIFSQEFRLTSTGEGPLQWLVGLYYFDESYFSDRNLDIMGSNVFPFFTRRGQDVDADLTGWAVFGQGTYELKDNLQLTLGVRYSDEESDAFHFVSYESPALPSFPNLNLGGSHTQNIKDDSVDYTASLRWDMNESVKAFFTTSTAFKSGGYQLAFTGDSTVDLPYTKESITSYELGFKTDLWDNRLKANVAFFYLDLEDVQVRTIRTFNNLPFTVVSNAAEATNKGVNLDFEFYPVDELKLTAAIGYTDAKFDDFNAPAGGVNFSGDPLRFVPEVTANLGAEFTFPVAGSILNNISLYGNWHYVDEQIQGFDGVDVDIEFVIEDYYFLDVGARLEFNNNVSATVFVNNVTDEYVATRHWNVFLFTNPGDVTRAMSTVSPPRHVGFRVSWDF